MGLGVIFQLVFCFFVLYFILVESKVGILGDFFVERGWFQNVGSGNKILSYSFPCFWFGVSSSFLIKHDPSYFRVGEDIAIDWRCWPWSGIIIFLE